MFAVLAQKGGGRLRQYVDKRFFREAHDADQVLLELSEEVQTILKSDALVETVVLKLNESLHARPIAILLEHNNKYVRAGTVDQAPGERVTLDGESPLIAFMRTRHQPLLVYFDDPASWIFAHSISAGEREVLKGLCSQLLLQLAFRNRLLGFVSLGPKQSDQAYSLSDLRLLSSVAGQIALALETSRLTEAVGAEIAGRERLERELEIARDVQQHLFPQSIPDYGKKIDLAGHCRPAQLVGGDYFDFIKITDDLIGIAIGDISGKGISAALLMASLQACLRSQAIIGCVRTIPDPLELLHRMSDHRPWRRSRYIGPL